MEQGNLVPSSSHTGVYEKNKADNMLTVQTVMAATEVPGKNVRGKNVRSKNARSKNVRGKHVRDKKKKK